MMPRILSNSKAAVNDDNGTGNHKAVYTVLYYKRKNKVHKSKGVSKMDGILTILAPPKSLVSLTTPTGTAVVGARRESEIASQEWVDDSILNLGQYEVEILSKVSTSSAGSSALNSNKSQKMAPRPLSTTSKNSTNVIRRRAVLGQIQESLASSSSSTSTTDIPLKFGLKKSVPAALSSAARRQPSTEELATATAAAATIPKAMTESLPHRSSSSVSSGKLALKRSLPQASRSQASLQSRPHKKLHTPPQHKREHKSSSSSTTADPVPSSATTISDLSFPGAVGSIDLPHSIASVLKAHQRSGVVFLWNCLTGNAEKSPHAHAHAHSLGVDSDDETSSRMTITSAYKGGCILADEMGLGKTLMTIATICALYRQRRDKKYIVVCPSSLVSNWAKEFDQWLGNACQPKRVVVNRGGHEGVQQIKIFCQPVKTHQAPQVLIVSFDIFRRNVGLFQAMPPAVTRLLVVDEGHRLKNTSKSLTLTALESVSCESRLLLTATPVQNVLSDFFTIADFCCPGLLGDLNTFRREFERPISAANNKNCTLQQRQRGNEQSRILDEITQTFMLRRLQKDILQTMLPPRLEVMLFCRPSALQCSLYQQLTSSQRKGVDGCGATADALKTLTNLRKLCLHPSLLNSEEYKMPEPAIIAQSGKVTILDQLLAEIKKSAPEDKVVIVSNFTSALGLIEHSILQPRSLSYVRLDGSTELSNRQSVVDTFNKTSSERTFAFLLSSKAGGCGLNLIGANRLIMFDPDWNPASDIQAMARVWRQGQQKPCTIYRLFTSGTVEEVICQRQIQKGNLASRAVDSKKGSASLGFSKEELRDCFTLKKNCACDTKEKVGDSWPHYDGPASIVSQGCDDASLIQVASNARELAFVHVVTEAPQEVWSEASVDDTGSITSEEEWQDFDEMIGNGGGVDDDDNSSSDEENEFE